MIELRNPVTGMHLSVLRSPQDAGADVLDLEATYPPLRPEPPDHLHPKQAERFEVLSGEVAPVAWMLGHRS